MRNYKWINVPYILKDKTQRLREFVWKVFRFESQISSVFVSFSFWRFYCDRFKWICRNIQTAISVFLSFPVLKDRLAELKWTDESAIPNNSLHETFPNILSKCPNSKIRSNEMVTNELCTITKNQTCTRVCD